MSSNAEQEISSTVSDPVGTYWIPLESDPDVMTEYLRMMTLTDHYLIDVPVIDEAEEMGIFDGHDVKAFIFLYELNKNSETETSETQASPPAPSDLFHIRQLVRNACGSIALFHAYLNTVDKSTFNPDSVMYKYYTDTVDQDFEKKGQAFATNENIRDLHHQSSLQGQSSVPSGEQLHDITYHFVAIIWKNGAVYKMDGRGPKPVQMGVCEEANFKKTGLEAIKQLIQRDPNNLNFSILAFCGN